MIICFACRRRMYDLLDFFTHWVVHWEYTPLPPSAPEHYNFPPVFPSHRWTREEAAHAARRVRKREAKMISNDGVIDMIPFHVEDYLNNSLPGPDVD